MQTRGFAFLPILLVILGILAVSGGVYFVMQKKAVPQIPIYKPTTTFTVSPTSGTAPLVVTFSLNGVASPNGYVVNVEGDEGSSRNWVKQGTSYVIMQTFPTSGTYHVSLFQCPSANQNCDGGYTSVKTMDITVLGNSQSVSVPGMSKYTDTDFGFSFWYPSSWTVRTEPPLKASGSSFGSGVIKKILTVGQSLGQGGATITEYLSIDRSISTSPGACGPASDCPYFVRYYFDTNTHTWMQHESYGYPDSTESDREFPANVSNNTMGGLHELNGYVRFGSAIIVPLSAKNFLYIENAGETGDRMYGSIVNTIVATDPAVATPVGAAEQIKVIQAEKAAYSAQ